MYQKRVREAIEEIKNGKMIIIMDDEDRENEGDLVMAGIFSTPQKINFMAQEARGLICVSITQEIALKLDLPPMVSKNDSNHETAFTVSIDAREAKTGISAYERDMTIRLMCDANASPSDFVRPGHIFPLIAKEGGVLARTGHTEASVDICKLAGVSPISVICEIMKKDGSMARRGDKFLLDFAKEQNLKILYVSDIIQYRLNYENLVSKITEDDFELLGYKCKRIIFHDHLGYKHTSFQFSKHCMDIPLVKFHSIRSDLELLENGAEFDDLLKSIEKIQKEGGYCIFLNSDSLQNKDVKDYGVGAQILRLLKVESFRLLSSSKSEYAALSGFNLTLLEKIEI
ncbi:bifunctional 3,4-dihydroxy-2-butanone 4-phosphate synthase/GTP cyclohydrolase II [Helicobacter muridarum]|uniref:3,4-dihydroxy-2-butanone 4-phosphate synthase n=1 Tax=Helicobacter muridarum TaxID=216 RepID=A0A099TYK0_9HELI|nr:bifunctional 3,4-dihydroxy-2-butanone 4-phosphate synthase/GTP cyclohydrolase II [Helicobacter muridarum]TLE01706.1 bifunctional 3,4-dihydroxy-2-butanone 4-phosphate synthase/GTP cyclohydrolase II [Helicobacter muridarum]STQ86346.1 bifunctional 3,4-dihydroxy-2-butanone 4-phosphate synthase/GTP cyclohydrolase II protein [Helicobacter muridarum]